MNEDRTIVNYLSPSYAKVLQHRIERFWKIRNGTRYNIKTWLEHLGSLQDENGVTRVNWVAVRSNIGPHGFPPKGA